MFTCGKLEKFKEFLEWDIRQENPNPKVAEMFEVRFSPPFNIDHVIHIGCVKCCGGNIPLVKRDRIPINLRAVGKGSDDDTPHREFFEAYLIAARRVSSKGPRDPITILLVNNCCGITQAFREELRRLFPEVQWLLFPEIRTEVRAREM